MANKTTVALTKEQYEEIIHYILTGTMYTRPNRAVATALVLEANLGLRLGDVKRILSRKWGIGVSISTSKRLAR